jgi:SAM-dependent methyltransferase
MEKAPKSRRLHRHIRTAGPSPWVRRFAPLIPKGGEVLDLACGGGRHARHLLFLGYRVVCLDKTVEPVAGLEGNTEIIEADLESAGSWPLTGRVFAGIVVTNYLYRPLFPHILDAIQPGGVLIYETFARGNEAYRRPRNPDHLLMSGELLELARGRLRVVAYEHGRIDKSELPGVTQRICAVNNLNSSSREDFEPEPLALFPSRPLPDLK